MIKGKQTPNYSLSLNPPLLYFLFLFWFPGS